MDGFHETATNYTHASTSTTSSTGSTSRPSFNKYATKARLWLTGLSEKIVCYGNIFDVMIQQYPQYVSLAWGTFKLLFVVSTTMIL